MDPDSGRRTKGTNLLGLVRMVKAAVRDGRIAALPPDLEAFLSQRIILSEWYPFQHLLALLRIAHERLTDGSDQAAIQLGEMGAHLAHEGVHSAFIKQGDPARTLEALDRVWPLLLDFGELAVERVGDDRARVTLTGYPDVPRVHALTLVGWIRATLAMSGATPRTCRIEHHPDASSPQLVIAASWDASLEK